jgi:hypothetical protein
MARNAFRINTVVDAPEKRTQINPNEPEPFPATKLPLKSLPMCGLALHFSPGFGKSGLQARRSRAMVLLVSRFWHSLLTTTCAGARHGENAGGCEALSHLTTVVCGAG